MVICPANTSLHLKQAPAPLVSLSSDRVQMRVGLFPPPKPQSDSYRALAGGAPPAGPFFPSLRQAADLFIC